MRSLDSFAMEMLPAVEREMQRVLNYLNDPGYEGLRYMLAYHLGWEGEGAGTDARGKRVRPLLVLLVCSSAGGDWKIALPAAAAVELIHNFSLIHDDIEDNSPLRRGRPTVWKRWGIPQAINAGDSMFSLAHLAMLDLQRTVSQDAVIMSMRILGETCVSLTQGQFLDISFESLDEIALVQYWKMIRGKTAALLSACTALGAIIAGTTPQVLVAYQLFGEKLGLAFQALDDILGIWGSAELIGKSTESDLLTGKKSLPVLYGLEKNGPFARRWREGHISSKEVTELARQLENEGARGFAQGEADRLTGEAMHALQVAEPAGAAGEALETLAAMLLKRKN